MVAKIREKRKTRKETRIDDNGHKKYEKEDKNN